MVTRKRQNYEILILSGSLESWRQAGCRQELWVLFRENYKLSASDLWPH
jgi:hypothetical protein